MFRSYTQAWAPIILDWRRGDHAQVPAPPLPTPPPRAAPLVRRLPLLLCKASDGGSHHATRPSCGTDGGSHQRPPRPAACGARLRGDAVRRERGGGVRQVQPYIMFPLGLEWVIGWNLQVRAGF
jgi:hypothetical protein